MATGASNYQCPACTGPLRFSGASGKLECDYCGSVYTVEEIEQQYAAKDAAAAASKLTVPNPEANVVFMATSTDTRYDAYSALRSITTANMNQ